MCGRYNVTPNAQAFIDVFDIVEGLETLPDAAMYNIAPAGIPVPIVRANEHGNRLSGARWPLIPFWFKGGTKRFNTVNAKGETVADKPAYRGPWQRGRRCLIPAHGYYEWQPIKDTKTKQPYNIRMRDGSLFAFAGLWDRWRNENGEAVESCTIITTPAAEHLANIHDRMPLILPRESYANWLRGSTRQAAALIHPFADPSLSAYRVTTHVNNPRNDDPRCLAPMDQPAP